MTGRLVALPPGPLQRLAREFLCYAGVGLLAALCHYAVLIAAVELLAVRPAAGAMCGFLVGGLVSYSSNRRWTFESDRAHETAVPRFALVAFVGFLLTGVFMSAFTELLRLHYLPSQVLTTGLVMIWTFLGNRYWTFRAHRT